MRIGTKPIKGNGIGILIPIPIFLLMCFLAVSQQKGAFHVWYELAGIIFGFAMSIPLILATNYEIREEGQIFAVRNKVFIYTFIAIIIIRILLHQYLQMLGTQTEMMILLAVASGYLIPWRVASYLKFRKIKQLA
ncbi:cytochrome c biogenesis protein CcdC [Shimazuella sp. AN120528]|nr:cytochrome c biogenesis protein CcdC [Shimazuella soli]